MSKNLTYQRRESFDLNKEEEHNLKTLDVHIIEPPTFRIKFGNNILVSHISEFLRLDFDEVTKPNLKISNVNAVIDSSLALIKR